MKYFTVALAILLVLILLCSCESKSEVFFDKDFEATVCYTRLGKEFTAVYTRENGCENVRFLSPKTLEGILVTKENGSVTVNYDGLSFTSVSDIFSPFELFSECTAKKSGENSYISEGGVTVITSGGFPKEVLDQEFKLVISEYRISEGSGTQ